MPGLLFDTTIWLGALLPPHPFHRQARQILADATPSVPAVFCRATQQSFLRLVSTRALLKTYGAPDLTKRDAVVALNALLAMPQVCEREEPPGVFAQWQRLAACDTASPKVWMDAYLAAFALGGGLRLVTLDHDFKAYQRDGLDLILLNP